MKSASVAFSRLVFNHSTKTVSQPSSLVRAVNSETLSVGDTEKKQPADGLTEISKDRNHALDRSDVDGRP
jgi:hypothetical protein